MLENHNKKRTQGASVTTKSTDAASFGRDLASSWKMDVLVRGLGFRVCRQCARGGCALKRGAPTNRALASACRPAPSTPTIRLSCSLLPLAALQKMCVSQQNGGLWVLAACAGRTKRNKGSQQTLRLSHPVRVRPGNLFCGLVAPKAAHKTPRPRNLPAWGPRSLRGPGPLESARLGPQTLCGWTFFWTPSNRLRLPRIPGICQPGAPDPPAGTPRPPQNTPKKPKRPSW